MARENPVILRHANDVFDVIDSYRTPASFLITLIALGGVFVDGYDFTSLGIGTIQLRQQFHLTAVGLGTITSSMAIGALIAAVVGGYFVDRVGRYKMFLLDLFLFVGSAIGAAFSPDMVWLLGFRFLMGVGVGLDFPAAMSFVAEYTNTKRRSNTVNLWGTVWTTAIIVGLLWILGLYYLVPSADLWRWAVGMGAVPAIVVLWARYRYMRESASWLARYGTLEEAAEVLTQTYGISVIVDPQATSAATTPTPLTLGKAITILKSPYGRRTLLASVLAMEGSIEFFGLSFYLPVISLTLFGKVFLYAILGSILFNVFALMGNVFGAMTTSRFGMRRLAMISCGGVIITLAGIGFWRHVMPLWLSVSVLAIYLIFHGFGPAIQGMGMASVSYPTEFRGVGTGWVQSMVRVGSITGFYLFPILTTVVGLSRTFLIVAIAPLVALGVLFLVDWDPSHYQADRANASSSIVNEG